MRLLAIGDIHGCLTAFNTLLDAVAPEPDDQIITLGDYIDRGPDSRGVLDRLIDLHAGGRVVALRGNHDIMMLEARNGHDLGWLAVGGKETLLSYGITESEIDTLEEGDSYFGDPNGLLARIPQRHWEFLEEDCLPYYETEKHIFVHANLYPYLQLDEQPDYMLYWERLVEANEHISGKTMICGHTRQKSGVPLDLDTSICIDTNVYDGGWLTCLDVRSGRIWQANERGETRTGWLGADDFV
ncbi:MAG TPA: metallophosphoesterase family protein [Gemmataceae bacterium]|nr:metallophosphoesterase family protein [Gemmataceae bacterium]